MLNQAFLIDSHTWLWWNGEPERLTPKAYDVIANSDQVVFSVVSAWEISIKYALGKLKLPLEPTQYIPDRLQINQMSVLPVKLEHALRVAQLPHHHRDPFDRLLVAISQIEGLTLITAYKQLEAYDIEILW